MRTKKNFNVSKAGSVTPSEPMILDELDLPELFKLFTLPGYSTAAERFRYESFVHIMQQTRLFKQQQ